MHWWVRSRSQQMMRWSQDFGSAANPARAHLSLLLRYHLTHRKCSDPRGPANGESWASEAVDTDVGEHQDWALTDFSDRKDRKPQVQKGPKGRKSLLSTVLKSFSAHRDPDGCSPAFISWIRSSLTLPWPLYSKTRLYSLHITSTCGCPQRLLNRAMSCRYHITYRHLDLEVFLQFKQLPYLKVLSNSQPNRSELPIDWKNLRSCFRVRNLDENAFGKLI